MRVSCVREEHCVLILEENADGRWNAVKVSWRRSHVRNTGLPGPWPEEVAVPMGLYFGSDLDLSTWKTSLSRYGIDSRRLLM